MDNPLNKHHELNTKFIKTRLLYFRSESLHPGFTTLKVIKSADRELTDEEEEVYCFRLSLVAVVRDFMCHQHELSCRRTQNGFSDENFVHFYGLL